MGKAWERFRSWPKWAQGAIGFVVVTFLIGFVGTIVGGILTAPEPTEAPTTAPAQAGPKTTFGQGQYRVGTDIAAGTYVAPGGSSGSTCYWERQSTFGGGGADSIIANDLSPGGQVVVTISASDKGFQTIGCGTWKRG